MISRRICGAVAVTGLAFSHHGAAALHMQGDRPLSRSREKEEKGGR
jgi:hypothetical protein